MHTIPCIIFAGGKSSRMGEDKALLPFGDFPTLTEFQLHKFQPHFKNVYISCKDKNKFDFQANFLEDNPLYDVSAPFIALISIFETLQCDEIFVLSVDTPFFETENFEKLLSHNSKESSIIVSKSSSGQQPLCAIYKKEVLPIMIDLMAEKRYRFSSLFDKISTKFVAFSDDTIFTNLNFPEDYKTALQRSKNG